MIVNKGKGKWLIRIYLGRGDDGKRKDYSETFYAHIKSLVQERELELKKKLIYQKAGPRQEIMYLGEYLDYWLENNKDSIRDSSYTTYSSFVRRLKPIIGHLSLWTLSAEQLNSVLTGQFDSLQDRSKKNLYDFTRTVVRSAIESRRAPQDALLGFRIPRAAKKERNVFTESELRKLLSNLQGYRYGLALRLLIVTGARAGEILGLCWDLVNFEKKTITIERTLNLQSNILYDEPKTANSRRTITLDDETIGMLAELKAQQNKNKKVVSIEKEKSLVFQTQNGISVRYSSIQKTWKYVLKKSNLHYIRIHDIRHSVITLLLNKGVPVIQVAALVGQDVNTTTGKYAHKLKVSDSLHF